MQTTDYVRRHATFLLSLAMILVAGGCATTSSVQTATRVTDFPSLPAPKNPDHSAYLGLPPASTNFTLRDIQADLIVVDLFDMYCHVCQTAAKHVMELEELTRQRGLGNTIKFIGLGVGNTPLEAATYAKKFNLPFPAFPDRQGNVARTMGSLKVPSLLVLRRRDGQLDIIHRTTGVAREAEIWLDHVLNDAMHMAPADTSDALHSNEATCVNGSPECGPEVSKATSLPRPQSPSQTTTPPTISSP